MDRSTYSDENVAYASELAWVCAQSGHYEASQAWSMIAQTELAISGSSDYDPELAASIRSIMERGSDGTDT